ncbi:MAG TPA: hypothetical protein VI299_07265 [Polyangiales bacterium]
MRWCWWFVFALSLTASAAADAPRVYLEWKAPRGSMCPTRATLDEDVAQLTGRGFTPEPALAEVHVLGRVERGELELIAHIEAHTADGAPLGTRELRADIDDCASLRRPLAMVLALLVDQPIQPGPSLAYEVGVEVAAVVGLLPRATGSIGASAFVAPLAGLGVRAQVSYLWPVAAETETGSGARMSGAGGALALCPRLLRSHDATLWLCAGARSGVLFARPRGLVDHETRRLAFADALAELTGSMRMSRTVMVWFSGGPTLALIRPDLFLERTDGTRVSVQRASQVGAIFRFGLTIGSL